MKKLMKAVAAAAVALVASSSFADLPSPTEGALGFEALDAGKYTVSEFVSMTDAGEPDGSKYWYAITNASQDASAELATIVEGGAAGGNKYLAIEAQAPLYRTINTSGNWGAELSAAAEEIPATGIYLDTMVKFTVSSDEFKADDLDVADKLAITCYSADDSGVTNILVRAGYVGSSVVATNYVMELPDGFDVDAWHRLTVRAIADVGSSAAPVGFAVYLDQTLLTYGTGVAVGDQTYTDALNPAVKQNLYNDTTHALLPSLVTTGVNKSKLTAVGFKGTGSLDNIQFTDDKPSFIVEGIAVSIAWDEGVASYKVMAGEDTLVETTTSGAAGSTNLTLDAGVTALTVTATYANGYEAGTWTVTGDGAEFSGSTFTVANGAELGIVSMLPKFDVGGVHYGTFAEALAAAVASETTATIKLMANISETISFSTGNIVVLDLCGMTIQGGDNDDYTINNNGATLTITNSVAGGEVKKPTKTNAAGALYTDDGSTTIDAGKFSGTIFTEKMLDPEASGAIIVNGGSFYDPDYDPADQESAFYLKDYVADGVTATYSNGYFTVGEQPAPTTYTVTVTKPDHVDYDVTGDATRDGDEWTVAVGQTITITATPAWNYEYATTPTGWTAGQDGAITIDVNAEGTVAIPAPTALAGWGFYLGRPVDGAYTIDNVADLNKLREGVAAGVTTANVTFKQTANVDMASAGAFAGIGTYAKVPTAGTPFLGTYDGQGFKISNVTRAGGNTQGIFNQVGPSGVIENLVVENMVFDSSVSDEYGFAIVGNAGGGATLRNLTAAGTFGSASKPSTHNMAGIVVRLSPGATAGAATTIDSCTNNATIYGGYTKLGGINAIVQNQTGFVDGKVVFVNCANNGTLVCKRTATDVTGNAGIVGYIAGTNVELTGCYGNGTITNGDGANTDKDGALVGWTYGGTIKDNGGNAAPADKKMIGTWGSATETGFLYATVADGVATTISGDIAAGGSYLLEGNAAPTIELAAVGDTIAFDTALGYTLTDTGITAASGLEVNKSTSGTVTTFTAATPAPSGLDPATNTPVEVTAADADAAKAAVALVTPTGVDAAEYKALFDFTATETSAGSGVYNVSIAGIKEDVKVDVEESAMDVLDGKLGAKVQVPAGLCYKVTTYTALGDAAVETKSGTSDGTGVSVAKPGTAQGFIKIEMATVPFN